MNRGEKGQALIVAVAATAAFAFLAFQVLATSLGAIAGLRAQTRRATLEAAADAGLMTAIQGLGMEDRTERWTIDGRSRAVAFDGLTMNVTVEDDRGKIPLNGIDEDQVRLMFASAGAGGDRLDQLVDSFEDWQDEDDDPRANGAEAPEYAPAGIRPRNGGFRTIEEMSHLRGMDPAILERLTPAVTIFFGESGGFSRDTANPLALAVMSGQGDDAPDVIQRRNEIAGERPAVEIASAQSLVGRPLTVTIDVSDGKGAHYRRVAIVELTGVQSNPYWVRWVG